MSPDAHSLEGTDVTQPSPARVYDYMLGGKDNYAVDRAAAARFLEMAPEVAPLPRHNRAWVGRVVNYLVGEGIDQFLDLGSGLPTQQNVHQIAQAANPAARVVYVDHDPIVLAQGHALLDEDGTTTYVNADVVDVTEILAASGELLDFSRPLGLLAASVLHYVPEDAGPARAMGDYIAALPPGSHVAIAHTTSDGVDPVMQARQVAVYQGNQYLRSAEQIRELFGGLELVDPGLVDIERWRADETVTSLRVLGGVAVKR